jgi:hypothetical protein
MKRRNFLKGAASGLAAAPLLSIGDLFASLKPVEPLPQIDAPELPDIQGTEFYINGHRIPQVISVMREQQSDVIEITTLDSSQIKPSFQDYATFTVSMFDPDGSIAALLHGPNADMDTVLIEFRVDQFVYKTEAYIQHTAVSFDHSGGSIEAQFRSVTPVTVSEREK